MTLNCQIKPNLSKFKKSRIQMTAGIGFSPPMAETLALFIFIINDFIDYYSIIMLRLNGIIL